MRSMSVSAPKADREVEFERDFGGDTLAEKVTAFGEKVVCDLFDQMATIKCAGVTRAALQARDEAGNFKYTDAQAIQVGQAYVPLIGVERKPKDIYAGIIAKINSGAATKRDVIKELEERLASLKAQE